MAFDKVAECARAGGSGLEIGCATGYHTEQLLKIGLFEAHGIDVSSSAIDAANRRFAATAGTASFKLMDANHLEFEDGRFDFVFGSGVIHHLELPRAVAEGRRVLRRGGRYIFMEPLGTNPLINLYRQRTPQNRSADETPLTADHLNQIRAIFDEVDVRYFGFFTLAAIPLRRWPGLQKTALALLRQVDRLFFKLPGAWKLAWMAVIDARVGHR